MKEWKKEIKWDLKKYNALKTSLNNIEKQIERTEDDRIKQIYTKKYNYAKNKLQHINDILRTLSEKDRFVLDMCYINKHPDKYLIIAERYCVEDAQVFRYLHQALENYYFMENGCMPE